MRKKVFLIHGTGERDGIGRESGGDLDTVSSNAFYGVWMEKLEGDFNEGTPEYGTDYEFDFVNYQEGLRHLDVHSGSDLYLPDFPIDALAPQLRINRLGWKEAAGERSTLYRVLEGIRLTLRRKPSQFNRKWKASYNELQRTMPRYFDHKSLIELRTARLCSELLYGTLRKLFYSRKNFPLQDVEDLFFGVGFEKFKSDLLRLLNDNPKQDFIDDINPEKVAARLLLDETARSDFGRNARVRRSNSLLTPLVEAQSTVVETFLSILELDGALSDYQREGLSSWCRKINRRCRNYIEKLRKVYKRGLRGNPKDENARYLADRSGRLTDWLDCLSYDYFQENVPFQKNAFHVQLSEEASCRPVERLEVVFSVSDGPVELSPIGDDKRRAAQITVETDSNGYAGVELHNTSTEDRYGVTATYDNETYLSVPENYQFDAADRREYPPKDRIELQLEDYLSEDAVPDESGTPNVDQIERGTRTAEKRTTRVHQTMITRHLLHLENNDVHLVRIDDHHPYTPELLDTLEKLQGEGVIDSIRLSSLPRGQHQPKEDQLCGADLIYEEFIEDTPADNEGLAELRRATHLQDLYIEEDKMAQKLSKLIGSRFSKIEMCRQLMTIDSEESYDSILRSTGWDEKIREYEAGLNRVLPRLGNTLHRLTFTIPPESGRYEDEINWSFMNFPLLYFTATRPERNFWLREKFLEATGRTVTFYAALSPFCDPEENEPKINVSSALNYLQEAYDFDYFMYAYGSSILSTRRVERDCYDVDLSNLVSQIGTANDGGHTGAASGSPSKNPNFPVERFESVNDRNFTEYLYYLSGIIEDVTQLDLHAIEDVTPFQYEANVPKHLDRLRDRVYELTLYGNAGTAEIGVARAVHTDDGEPEIGVPLAVSHIRETFPELDYVFLSRSTSSLIMRNYGDERRTLNLDEIARLIGTFEDGGHPRAAKCRPRFNPEFPAEQFDYVNSENMREYVEYLGRRIRTGFSIHDINVSRLDPNQ